MSNQAPSKPYRLVSVVALVLGIAAFGIGLFNAKMQLNEKGYYLTVLLYGLFSAVSLQKSIRDKAEDIPTTPIYVILAWVSTGCAIGLLTLGLVNADLLLSEKGFYGMAFALSLFAAVTVQKNVRDTQAEAVE
jgi:uncharacterized membrane protein YiaA